MSKKILLFFILTITIAACRKKTTTDTNTSVVFGKMTIHINNVVGGNNVQLNTATYTNAAGNNYTVSLLKYYLSNFMLTSSTGKIVHIPVANRYNLIIAADTSSLRIVFDSIPQGTYTGLTFSVGVDTSRDHKGDQTGALDPVNDMIWSWNTGYIFFKHEGAFIDSTGANEPIYYYYGTDKAYVTCAYDITSFKVKGDAHNATIKFDLNALYSDPYMVNFNGNNNHQSTSTADNTWIATLKANFPQAFSIESIK